LAHSENDQVLTLLATASSPLSPEINAIEYRGRIRAWTLYDWANSAFATTIMAAVLPVFYSKVAGATLPSPAVATAYWSAGLSISLLIVALLSPLLGAISDVARSKKRFLASFCGLGVVATASLALVNTGDWLFATLLFILGRIGFVAANVFYDALLPHVARAEDRDAVSAQGFALGYLGGGLLLALNLWMIQTLPGNWGTKLTFVSVALWWAVFSIPLLRQVPEPPAATGRLAPGAAILSASFNRLWETLKNIRRYRELFKGLLAFLIYADGIGTIISLAAIYGAELGFSAQQLILALLVVQFVAIPYSLIFGRLPDHKDKRQSIYLALVVINAITLPLLGIGGARLLPPASQDSIATILGLILLVEAGCLLLAWFLGRRLFSGLAARMDTKGSILLALGVYAVIAIWGYFIGTVIEFWCIAWMVALVQGGSQALSRSLFSSMVPASKSGEFFGIVSVMEKFSAILGPLIFVFATALLGSSRPAVLSIVVFFVIGGALLYRVDVKAGQRVAQAEDAALLAS
jgi:UMF1 family MFS transporter